jgi:hypothetical protein
MSVSDHPSDSETMKKSRVLERKARNIKVLEKARRQRVEVIHHLRKYFKISGLYSFLLLPVDSLS